MDHCRVPKQFPLQRLGLRIVPVYTWMHFKYARRTRWLQEDENEFEAALGETFPNFVKVQRLEFHAKRRCLHSASVWCSGCRTSRHEPIRKIMISKCGSRRTRRPSI